MNITVFSRNRGAQLDLLLRSLERYTPLSGLRIIHRYDEDFLPGLKRCQGFHSGHLWIEQEQFQQDLLLTALDPADPLTLFLCDDDVFVRPFGPRSQLVKRFAASTDIACLSLRMDPRYNYCFDADLSSPAPRFAADGTWEWQKYFYDWGYPMCVCTHLFQTADLWPLLEEGRFDNPNELESYLADHPINKPKMLCYPKAKTVNTPLNLVQHQFRNNRAGDITPASLESHFMAGERLSLEHIVKTKFISCQQIVEPVWV